ncbi:hypothetical protein RHGRI_012830 [Rhododendron griersonianum]|uniref:SNF2 N-terminal domain-containing protein n=1 Tax=Rhododendron griersonianum TaxID=479676 RepID=A0AAV6KSG7_9ERIC|nr:hypothetical protein RHGRI_012830 [Rhododendron griersonianum]
MAKMAIAVTTCIRDAWPVLVLTPSSLRLHWASMIQQWLNIPSSDILVYYEDNLTKIHIRLTMPSQMQTQQKSDAIYVDNKNGHRAACPGVVCGGDTEQDRVASGEEGVLLRAAKYLTTAAAEGMGVVEAVEGGLEETVAAAVRLGEELVVIADESHFLKNGQAKRTSASLPILQKAQYAILLSGTPALSRPIELFKQLEALYPNVYKNVHEFGNRYCKGGIFGVYQGASNHEELHNLMKATLMIRRLKRDVLSELPVKRRQQLSVLILSTVWVVLVFSKWLGVAAVAL